MSLFRTSQRDICNQNTSHLKGLSQARRFVVIEGGDGVPYRCVTQPNSAGVWGALYARQRDPGQSPGGKRILATIY